jgi:hypothetical protein
MSYKFNNSKYTPADGAIDAADAYGNKGYSIGIRHMISDEELYFKAFITAFNETYSSDYAVEQVYGRADGIYAFKNTSRSVTLAFKVPGFSPGEAYENLAKIQRLVQFLYPAYEDVNNATTITQSPLVRIKVMNLLQRNDNQGSPANTSAQTLYDSYTTGEGADNGTLGVITSLTVNHNLENTDSSMIEKVASADGTSGATILPTFFEINLDFKPIHHYPLGWFAGEGGTNFATPQYPYGALLEGSSTEQIDSAGSATYPPTTEDDIVITTDDGVDLFDSGAEALREHGIYLDDLNSASSVGQQVEVLLGNTGQTGGRRRGLEADPRDGGAVGLDALADYLGAPPVK